MLGATFEHVLGAGVDDPVSLSGLDRHDMECGNSFSGIKRKSDRLQAYICWMPG